MHTQLIHTLLHIYTSNRREIHQFKSPPCSKSLSVSSLEACPLDPFPLESSPLVELLLLDTAGLERSASPSQVPSTLSQWMPSPEGPSKYKGTHHRRVPNTVFKFFLHPRLYFWLKVAFYRCLRLASHVYMSCRECPGSYEEYHIKDH